MTDRDLTRAEVEALLDGTTPGPWSVERNKRTWGWVDVAGPSLKVGGPTQATDLTLADEVKRLADASLIAAAPTLARQLLRCMKERNAARGALMNAGAALHVAKREAEAAEAENARLRAELEWQASQPEAHPFMATRARAALKPALTVTAGWPTEEGEGSIIVGETK